MENRMTAQQLKNSILQMAVQGKLVPQDPNDEPASVLLERIRKEKEQLIKDGKIKKNKKESYIFRGADNLHYEQIGKEVRCIEDELPFEIPVNWVWCRMNSIGTMIRGNGIKRCEIVDEGLPCIRYGEIYTSYNLEFRKVFSKIPQQLYDSCKKIKHGDLIFTLTGENKPDIAKTIAYLGDTEIAAGGDLAIWSNHHMNPLYLSYLLYSPYMISKKISLATGDIIVHISVDKVGSFLAPIPPLEEQNKIVNRLKMLESLISKYSEKENELYALNSNIKEQLKKSILQYAIEGKLVQQDSNDEPASVLLERIREEKNKLIAEGKIKKDKNESIIYRRDNSYYEKCGSKTLCIDEEIPFEIPNDWGWIRLGKLTYNHGQKKPNCDFCYIDIGSINNKLHKLNENEVVINVDKAPSRARKIVEFGDILYATVRPYLHNMCIMNRNFSLEPIASTGFAVLTCHSNYLNEFLFMYMMSPVFDQYANKNENSRGVAYPAINDSKLRAALIPVPSVLEQHKIIDKYKSLMNILS